MMVRQERIVIPVLIVIHDVIAGKRREWQSGG
jgi:hypothetical protein